MSDEWDAIEARMEHGRQDVRWMSQHAASGQTADDIAVLLAAVRERDAELVKLRAQVERVEALINLADLADPPYRNILHAWHVRAALAGEES